MQSKQVEKLHCDLLIAGSGAGGLSAAVTAAHHGLKVIVAEKDALVGGTSAISGGWMWVPRNPLAVKAGINDPAEDVLTYLHEELEEAFDESLIQTYLKNAPLMLEFFEHETQLRFVDGNGVPDFHGKSKGAVTGGRSVCAAPFDGRALKSHISLLKPPLKETTLWGMAIASGADLRHFLNARQSASSLWHVCKRLAKHAADMLLYRRSMQLVNGNALVAALLASAIEKGVEIKTGCPVKKLTQKDGRITGAVLESATADIEVTARFGVVLACGGFAHDAVRKKDLLPHAPTGMEHWSAASLGNTGDGLRLAEQSGAHLGARHKQAAALAPVSLVPQTDGSFVHFPHLIERAKPGLIAVTDEGNRFVNEADSYYDFVLGMFSACKPENGIHAWLLCDHSFIRKYGLGAVKPAPMPLGKHLKNGYLLRGKDLGELARLCGINASALQATVQRYNSMAAQGEDLDFAKGKTPYNRVQGDAANAQKNGLTNPCMAPVKTGPFYAMKVVPGSLGTFTGVASNASAQALGSGDLPIEGLYAVGNDMHSIMGGRYPSGGITLGPAMTFGFIIGNHAAKQATEQTTEHATERHSCSTN